MYAQHRDLLGDSEVVIFGIFPVDEPDCLHILARPGTDLHTVAQQTIYIPVDVVEAAAMIACHLFQLKDGFVDKALVVAEYVFEERDDTFLSENLMLSDVTYYLNWSKIHPTTQNMSSLQRDL